MTYHSRNNADLKYLDLGESLKYVFDESFRNSIDSLHKRKDICMIFNYDEVYECDIDSFIVKELPAVVELIDNRHAPENITMTRYLLNALFDKDHDIFKSTDVIAHIKDAHTLNLSHTRISDVSALGGVFNLNLSYTSVTDVSALGAVVYLTLHHTNVSDVKALGDVHYLNLSHTKVTDVSALGNVNTLFLDHTDVSDVSALGNVKILDISNTKVRDVSALGNAELLHIINTEVTDISALGNVGRVVYINLDARG